MKCLLVDCNSVSDFFEIADGRGEAILLKKVCIGRWRNTYLSDFNNRRLWSCYHIKPYHLVGRLVCGRE